jgi:hypothetical protein
MGSGSDVVFRYGIYFAFVSPLSYRSPRELIDVQRQMAWENDLDQPDENFVCAVNEQFTGNDTFEIGYPEKLVTISADWNVVVKVRGGRLNSNVSLLSDEDIIKMAKTIEGGSTIYLAKLSSPQFAAEWKELTANIPPVLLGNARWSEITPLFLSEIENEANDATVSVSIYNPFNFPMTLFYLSDDDQSKCARLEIAVDHASVGVTRIVVSVLAWDGKNVKETPGKMMKRIYGSFDEWSMRTHFHQTYEREDKAMAVHGFSSPVVELTFSHGNPPEFKELTASGGKLHRSSFCSQRYKDVAEFVDENSVYLKSLQRYLRARVGGI